MTENGNHSGGPPVIVPPPEIRGILEKLVTYVVKNGRPFEEKLRIREINNPKFAFLFPGDPYYPYYEQALAAAGFGSQTTDPSPSPPPPSDAQPPPPKPPPSPDSAPPHRTITEEPADEGMVTQAAPDISKARAAMVKEAAARPVPTQPPDHDVFTVTLGNDALAPTALELEVMKLTAQFAAKNGRGFLASVTSREARNPLFQFLNPMHVHHGLFRMFAEAYSRILNPTDALRDKLRSVYGNRKVMIDRAYYRADWERIQEQSTDEMNESDRTMVAAIDWNDFVVVETVTLDDDDENLPAPIQSKDVAGELRMREQSAREAAEEEEADMEIDEEPVDMAVSANADIPTDRVRKNYTPAVKPSTAAVAEGRQKLNVLLPSGQTVPAENATESMKVHLLDPRYKEERSRALEKNAHLNLATNAEIARNLGHLNAKKTEVFGRKDLQEAVAAQKAQLPDQAPAPLVVDPVPAPQPAPVTKAPTFEDVAEHQDKRLRFDEVALQQQKPVAKAGLLEGGSQVPGEEWIKRVGQNVRVRVQLPKHQNKDWQLDGRTLDLEVPLTATVAQLKASLAGVTKCPANKQKLQVERLGFLKDAQTLASYNIMPSTLFSLEVKERGGKKK